MTSLWIGEEPRVAFPALADEVQVEVVVVGAGITGLMCALALSSAGRRVAVLEADRVGHANTGHSTGNLYGTVSTGLARLRDRWSAEEVRTVVAARMAAVRHIEDVCERHGLQADLVRCPMTIGASDAAWTAHIERERAACDEAGLAPVRVDGWRLGRIETATAFRMDGQAQCDPYALAVGLARVLRDDGVLLYEASPVTRLDARPCCVETDRGRVRAEAIVLATHSPLGFNLVQAEMKPWREYGVSARSDMAPPAGIHWLKDAGHSLRGYRGRVVAIGEKHGIGDPEPGGDALGRLKAHASTAFGATAFDHAWSAQQFASADGLPYIGRSAHDNVYIATGFGADGLVWGTVAARIIAELMADTETELAHLLRPRRFTPVKSARGWAEENASVVRHMVGDRLRRHADGFADVPIGGGRIVDTRQGRRAVHRSASGRLHVLSPVCPHLKCLVAWNDVESTWDCPCHGSRFHADGRVLEGPALTGLAPCEGDAPDVGVAADAGT
jgi:glycine/D-amino acid oxidase-like deaminating enzyme/nitrite reductase/ring-hydroxylating ferredoxin subunit